MIVTAHRLLLGILFGVTLATAGVAATPDLARERRLANEIADTIVDGEPLYLHADGHAFLAIDTRSETPTPKGYVLLLHGRGFHPDWADVIHPLRVGLTERGWNTLSIQLPVLDKAAKYNDYVDVFPAAMPRIEAAIAYLQGQGAGRIVVLAHSCGAHMAQHWINVRGAAALATFDAFVGIGLGATDYGQPMQEEFALGAIRVPVLDVYGGADFPAVLRLAPARRALLDEAGNGLSRQVEVPGADHYFRGHSAELVAAVAAWLDCL